MTDKQRLIYDLSLQCAAAQYTQYTKDGKTTQAAMLAAFTGSVLSYNAMAPAALDAALAELKKVQP